VALRPRLSPGVPLSLAAIYSCSALAGLALCRCGVRIASHDGNIGRVPARRMGCASYTAAGVHGEERLLPSHARLNTLARNGVESPRAH